MTNTEPPEDIRTLNDVIESKANEHGDETFLLYRDREVSYVELNEKAEIIASSLLEQGTKPGDHVCLLLYNSPQHLFTFFALSKIGAVVTPIDTRFTGDTLRYVLTESNAETIILDSRTKGAYEEIRNEVPNLKTEYFISGQRPDPSYRSFNELLSDSGPSLPDLSVNATDTASLTYVQRHPADRPRGVLMPHFSYVNTGWEAGQNLFNYTSDDRLFTTLPLYSIFTTQLGVIGGLLSDAQFAIEDRFEPEQFWDQIEMYQATKFLYLSRMLSVLYNQDIDPGGDTSADVAIGASPGFAPDVDLFKNFEDRFGVTVYEGYGSTQVSTLAVYNRPGDRKLDSVGKPPSYVDVKIFDENDWAVPTGERGEIVVRPTRTNTMMKGYYNDPEQTVEDCRNQWIHTGGIGYKDQDGYVYFVASQQNSIYRGRIAGRISSLEIESVINGIDSVKESAVVGVVHDDRNEEIKAVVVPEDSVDINPVEICEHCKRQLPYLKVPRYIEVREELPRSPAGKIQKEELKKIRIEDVWDRESGYELSR